MNNQEQNNYFDFFPNSDNVHLLRAAGEPKKTKKKVKTIKEET